ncbi:zinc ribbon domain-containing protein [Verrucomicrobiota bacterium]
MILCDKCGAENELGRVFCTGCGSKLDLTNLSSEAVSESLRENWFLKHWKKFLYGVLVLLALVVALVFWPKVKPIGRKGTHYNKRRLERQLRSFVAVGSKKSMSETLKEEDINGYFEYSKAEKIKADYVGFRVHDRFFAVRVVRPLWSWKISSLVIEPKISYDLFCVPVQGGRVAVRKAWIGHLRLMGPWKNVAVKSVCNMVANEKEWKPFRSVTKLSASKGKLSVTIKK